MRLTHNKQHTVALSRDFGIMGNVLSLWFAAMLYWFTGKYLQA
jgi:hypothetical protein